mgnify:CR=1 FL=1
MNLKRLFMGQRFAYSVVSLALLAGLLTFVSFTQWSPLTDNPDLIVGVLITDLVVVVVLSAVIGIRLFALLRSKEGVAGSRLHRRLALFSALLAAAPTLFFAAFGGVYFYMGVQSWFNEKVQVAIRGSEDVAQAYLAEHQQTIRADGLAMASDLTRYLSTHNFDQGFVDFFRSQTYVRNLSEAILMDDKGRTLAQSGLAFSLSFDAIPSSAFAEARDGDPVLFFPEDEDRIRALISLNTLEPYYLYVGRMVDENVLDRVRETREAAHAYNDLRKQSNRVQRYSVLMFAATGLLLVLTAVWFGLSLARRMMMPLGALMAAAERVGGGDYTARVPEFKGFDEFHLLAKTFNTMTQNITETMELRKQAAWGEVARRVAHEIKNPLTPIQLAAERLRRKYSDQITTDKEIFDESISTIIKHVDDLKNMVNEFGQMAQMERAPIAKGPVDLVATIRALVTFQQQAYPKITFSLQSGNDSVAVLSDESRLRQALLNLITNAQNALMESDTPEPRIAVKIERRQEAVRISVMDNGPGYPEDATQRARLLEPYVTSRKKGTGLGLAIVQRIAEDLGGKLILSNGRDGMNEVDFAGAHATLVLPA